MADFAAAAASFASLFPACYLRFHRRDEKGSELTQATRAVLQHLAMTGPLTIGEAARHLGRAQSVVSEIVDGLAAKGLLERVRDPRDGRRTLVWLTESAVELLERERDVLSRALLERAMKRMSDAELSALLLGMRALLRADEAVAEREPVITHKAVRRIRRIGKPNGRKDDP